MTISREQIRARIRELEATPREMVQTDEGTHGGPACHYVYEEVTGERYGVRSFAGASGVRITEAEAEERTDGRMRVLNGNQSRIRAARRELAELRRQLRRMS